MTPAPESRTRVVTSAEVRNVIVRACAVCGHGRVAGEPCAGCGNEAPPVVHDLGVQSAFYRNPVRRLGWLLIGQRLAARRARAAAKAVGYP
jgi:hypothetical protein